tara:strand:+ start:14027 stop:19279 length:5253 start_codon:yes stop_codon:yes gene_type:complete
VSAEVEILDAAVAEGGAYEVIRKRLVEQGQRLNAATEALNRDRLAEFGNSDISILGRVRVRTENNCVARDIVQVGDVLLFGYNVFIGLKKETRIADVFALFRAVETDGALELVNVDTTGTFLADPSFRNDFDELYRYYKDTRLLQLTVKDGKLLAGFQIGDKLSDLRVFRWSVSADGKTVSYIDNRGERDIQLPSPYDFEWTLATRDDEIHGRHAHINILDTLFVDTTGGDLTIKVENNTEVGLGIYREPVDDKTQSLGDGQFSYARVGSLILLKVRPYRESKFRYLVYNTLTETVLRIDAIGESCVQLPEDHGIIFPGGYYLQSGDHKAFADEVAGLKFKRMIRSPNGEDVLYIFYEPEAGLVALFTYNMIARKLGNPIYGHGYALAEDGRIIIFSAEDEPTRVHPMQIWRTPYESVEHASRTAASNSFCGRIGNAELVRGISDLYSVVRLIDSDAVSLRRYEELSQTTRQLFDKYYWLSEPETAALSALIKEVEATSELVVDEFEKVDAIRQQSATAIAEAVQAQQLLLVEVTPDNWRSAEAFVDALAKLRRQRGHLVTIKDLRYIDVNRISAMEAELLEVEGRLAEQTVAYLSDEAALTPYHEKLDQLGESIDSVDTVAAIAPLIETIEQTAVGLDLLSELMGTLKIQDANVRTRIIEAISHVYSGLNQAKARAVHKRKGMGSKEAVAQFGAQFKLFSQSIANALGVATTPDKCDEQLARLLVQLEELESQFSDHEEFLADIMQKREEIYEAFEAHKQQLLDERQRKAQSVADAAGRMLASIEKRSMRFTAADELNTYFASDALVLKVRELIEQLRSLGSATQADDIESRFKATREQAQRSLRDKADIFEEGGNVIKLGPRHRFSVNTQELDITIIPRSGELYLHLTGTDYFEPVVDPRLLSLREYWNMTLASETPAVYRAEFLAAEVIDAADREAEGLSRDRLREAMLSEDMLTGLVRAFSEPRYQEGYEKGIHDVDAARILMAVLPAMDEADLLIYDPTSRAIAQLFWAALDTPELLPPAVLDAAAIWPARARSASNIKDLFASSEATNLLAQEIAGVLERFLTSHDISIGESTIGRASLYLVHELSRDVPAFISSRYAGELLEAFRQSLETPVWAQFQDTLDKLKAFPGICWNLSTAWLKALVENRSLTALASYIPEVVAHLNTGNELPRRASDAQLELRVEGLLGDHKRLQDRTLTLSLDDYLQRMAEHRQVTIPAYRQYLEVRQDILAGQRKSLRLNQYKARPLSSFVRNRLINESYLPLIGDNLAKQMGTLGENKRTDLMGLLMMISPPGYGKTTLMEYMASRLGLIFMKINCPSLGHDVLSLDPEQAPNATARQELEKLNLGLEMGSNVMLYLDDIQHTHPEFLQKFISLCDGTRRIEGVWKGETKTYDMRGKKFCVVMAGNPYTESGEAFKVPDMLANRADIYNLGDILGGMDEQFALSYIENALTSNAVLAPLAVREMEDVYKLIGLAKGRNVATTDLSHQYSGAEINEIKGVLQKMFVIQEVVLKINQQYVASAAQNDDYRTEPPFKLQGSYRNMNKMSEKVSSVMNQAELMQMIEDHYLGEAQLLTTGAEDNLLKLAELRGNMTEAQQTRWMQIKKDFMRAKAMGGSDADVGSKVVAQLLDLVAGVEALGAAAREAAILQKQMPQPGPLSASWVEAADSVVAAVKSIQPRIEVVNQPDPAINGILSTLADTIEHSLMPVVQSMDKKIDIDLKTQSKMFEIATRLRDLQKMLESGTN